MSETPRVTLASEEFTDRENGASGTVVYDVVAASGPGAADWLRDLRGVGIGTLYRDSLGQTPRARCRCRTIATKNRAPAPPGREGLFRLTCSFDTVDPGSGTGGGDFPDPGEVVYEWGRGEASVTPSVDAAGKAIANSKGEPYRDVQALPVPHRTLRVKWWRASYDLAGLFGYDGSVNSGPWRIAGQYLVTAGQSLCHGIDPGKAEDGLTPLVGSFEFRPGGLRWDRLELVDLTIEDGKQKFLDGDGRVVELEAGDEPTVNTFDLKAPLRNHAALGI